MFPKRPERPHYLPVRYGIEITAPSLDQPSFPWQVSLLRNDTPYSLISYEGKVLQTVEFPHMPTKDQLTEWVSSLFPVDPSFVDSLVLVALGTQNHSSVLTLDCVSDGYGLSMRMPQGFLDDWSITLYRRIDTHFFKWVSVLDYSTKPTRDVLQKDIVQKAKLGESIVSNLLDALLLVYPDAFDLSSIAS